MALACTAKWPRRLVPYRRQTPRPRTRVALIASGRYVTENMQLNMHRRVYLRRSSRDNSTTAEQGCRLYAKHAQRICVCGCRILRNNASICRLRVRDAKVGHDRWLSSAAWTPPYSPPAGCRTVNNPDNAQQLRRENISQIKSCTN